MFGDIVITKLQARRYEQNEAREENLRARTKTYVTESCRSATMLCDAYMDLAVS